MRTLVLLIGLGAIALFVLSLWRRSKGRSRRDKGGGSQGRGGDDEPGGAGTTNLAAPAIEQPALPRAASSPETGTATLDAALTELSRVRLGLHALAFDTPRIGDRVPSDEVPLITRALNLLEGALDDGRYMPRRPSILPELLRAVGNDDTSLRELAGIIARDPSLAAELLRLANSPFYRLSQTPIESIDRAIARLGTQGLRALVAAALLQPVFQIPNLQARLRRFPSVTWEHAFVSGVAAETSAALIESEDPFAAQLLALLVGLGSIVVFRVASDVYAEAGRSGSPEALALLIDRQAAPIARRIAASWQLSDRMLQALNEQSAVTSEAAGLDALSPLGRCLARGRTLGALVLIAQENLIGDDAAKRSAIALGVPALLVDRIWLRLRAQGSTLQ